MKAIDLFAGCGGLSLGFLQAGYSIDRAVEYDPVIANTYQKNHPEVKVIVDDIKNIDAAGTFKLGDADVIIGGPPCQGFSMAGARIRHGFIDDPRNYLFKHYFNVVRTVKPMPFCIPDIIIYDNDTPVAVIDAKYKMSGRPDRSDSHQLLAYVLLTGVQRCGFILPGNKTEVREMITSQDNYLPLAPRFLRYYELLLGSNSDSKELRKVLQ